MHQVEMTIQLLTTLTVSGLSITATNQKIMNTAIPANTHCVACAWAW